jgi:RHS repeat-associated protein
VTGTTCNTDGYDSFDNLLKRTDARGVLTSYGYDTLNRITSASYNVGTTGVPATATVGWAYGTSTSSYNNGRPITMTDGVGSENYTYNNLGQMNQLQKVINGTTYTTNYLYNVANEPTKITYPSGRVVQQSVDAIGRLCEVAPSTTGCGSASSPFVTGLGYNAASQVTGFKYGNGIYASLGFSADRMQLNCLDYSTTNRTGSCTHDSTTKFGLTYSYGSAGSNNGLFSSISDSVDSGRNAAYTYDALNRLTAAVTTGSASYPAWGLSETYDRYGNRLAQTAIPSAGCVAPMTCPQPSVNVSTTTNQITGSPYTYDASGNMTNDGYNTLIVYDAENHAVSATNGGSSGAYAYDGNGLRVQKCVPSCTGTGTTTSYVFSGSKVVGEYDYANGTSPTATSPSREYLYAGDNLVTKIDSTGPNYYHQDHLSNRLVTDSSGATIEQMGTYPYGESLYNASGDKLIFTTYERDSESGNDYAMARYYGSRFGRFSSTDPLAGTLDDPQTLNSYTYVRGNPVSLVDPSGQDFFTIGGCTYESVSYSTMGILLGYDYYFVGCQAGGVSLMGSVGAGGTCGADLLCQANVADFAQQQAARDLLHRTNTSADYLRAVAQGANRAAKVIPVVCDGGVFGYAGAQGHTASAAEGFVGYLGEYDTSTGWSNNGLVEGGGKHLSGGIAGNLKGGEPLLFVPITEAGGAVLSKSSIGGYIGTGGNWGFGVGAYVTITSVAGCQQRHP